MKARLAQVIERLTTLRDTHHDDEFTQHLENALIELESASDRLVALDEELDDYDDSDDRPSGYQPLGDGDYFDLLRAELGELSESSGSDDSGSDESSGESSGESSIKSADGDADLEINTYVDGEFNYVLLSNPYTDKSVCCDYDKIDQLIQALTAAQEKIRVTLTKMP